MNILTPFLVTDKGIYGFKPIAVMLIKHKTVEGDVDG
jgi:hypothetical protein